MTSIEQAPKIYELCVVAAKTGKKLTYGEVLDSLGYKGGVSGDAIRYGLELVLIGCGWQGLPKLTAIVVNQATLRPTPGTTGQETGNWEDQIEQVRKQQTWPAANEMDWLFFWRSRKELSDRYGTPGYWQNRRKEGK